MHHKTCQERDRIILAFALAMSERNNASMDLETATSDSERSEALRMIEAAKGHSHRLHAAVLTHCEVHGC